MPGKMVIPEISAEQPEPLVDPFGYATHEVFNQPPPLENYDAFGTDEVLKTIVRTFGAEGYQSRLHQAGIVVGSSRVKELARQANRSLPELRTHDRFGQRVDRIDFHPAWHELMGLAIAHDTHALCWNEPGRYWFTFFRDARRTMSHTPSQSDVTHRHSK